MDKRTRRRGRARQLTLDEQTHEIPIWMTLPEPCRREVVELLARLLRNEAARSEEGDDE